MDDESSEDKASSKCELCNFDGEFDFDVNELIRYGTKYPLYLCSDCLNRIWNEAKQRQMKVSFNKGDS
jgi:uncharacterized protein YlaI